jgi:hypothetical protein
VDARRAPPVQCQVIPGKRGYTSPAGRWGEPPQPIPRSGTRRVTIDQIDQRVQRRMRPDPGERLPRSHMLTPRLHTLTLQVT